MIILDNDPLVPEMQRARVHELKYLLTPIQTHRDRKVSTSSFLLKVHQILCIPLQRFEDYID